MSRILVVGAGWAGLSAALALSEAGRRVTLVEAAALAGGRARSLRGQPLRDNGQHLLIGAYRETLGLLERLGIRRDTAFHDGPLDLLLRPAPSHPVIRVRGGHLPGRLHLLQGLIGAQGLDWRLKRALLGAGRLLSSPPAAHLCAHDWLLAQGQPMTLIERLWGPLCLAALNLPVACASARIFHRTLREAFASAASARLLIPRQPLGALLPTPAIRRLEWLGADIRLGTRVAALCVHQDRITGVRLRDGDSLEADQVILATAPAAAVHLLEPLPATRVIAESLRALGRAPIATAYLRYDPQPHLDPPMQALLDGTGAWLFDRRVAGEPGVVAAVVSGPGPLEALDRDTLARSIAGDVGRHFPCWGTPLEIQIIRERAATFLATPANDARRPDNATAVAGLWLAGDYTATGLPATLEGAVRSGLECSTQIMRRMN